MNIISPGSLGYMVVKKYILPQHVSPLSWELMPSAISKYDWTFTCWKTPKSASAVKLCTQNDNHQTYQNVSGEHSIHNHMHAVVSVFGRSWTNSIHQQWPGYESETHRQSTTSISTVFTNRWPITVVWSNNFLKTYSGNQLLPLAEITDNCNWPITSVSVNWQETVHSWTWNHHVDKYGTDSEEIFCTSPIFAAKNLAKFSDMIKQHTFNHN